MALTYQGLESGGLWAGNRDEIIIGGVTDDVRIRFTVSDSSGQLATFTERYTAIDGKIRILRLGDIAKTYFKMPSLESTSQLWGVRPVISGEVFDLDGGSLGSFSQAYYYSEFPMEIPLPANYKSFLTRYSSRTILPGQLEYLAWIDHSQDLIIGILYSDEIPVYGQTATQPKYKQISVKAGNSHNIRIEKLSLSRIQLLLSANGISVSEDHILSFDAYLYEGNILIDKIQFRIDRNSKIQRQDVIYFNPFWIPAALILTGQNQRSADFNATYLNIGTLYRKVDTNLVIKNECYTGYIDRQSRDAVYDLAVSEPLFRFENSKLQQITLLDLDISESEPSSEPICLKITFRISDDERQLNFTRPTWNNNKVFDISFDNSFN